MSAAGLASQERAAAAAVERFARKALADSPMFGRESALTYALGYIEPTGARTAAEEIAKIRGVFAGLRAAGVAGFVEEPDDAIADQRAAAVTR